MTENEIIKEKEIVISQIKEYAPQLKPLFDLDIKLKDYPDNLFNFKIAEEHLKRQKLLKKVIENKIKKLFGEDYKKKLKINLDSKMTFNIADHHQILNHPLLISANFISSANKFLKNKKQEAVIVISSGDVPPNNYFSKNGFSFHDKKVPLFSNSEREFSSYYIPKRDFNFIKKLKISDKWKDFNKDEQDFLVKEYDNIKLLDFSNCNDYKDQITVIVKNTWPLIFEEKIRKNIPDLIYLTQEEIVSDVLIELLKGDNIVSRCLFDNDFRKKVLDNFRGIVVAWKEDEERGTHFFWRKYPDRPQSLRLYVDGNKLVPKDERFKDLSVPLERGVIIELLKKKEIYPSLFMIFGVLNFYSGVKPLVGYGSVTYLNLMKQAWVNTLKNTDLESEIKLLKKVQTDGLIAGLPIFFKRFNGKLKTLYACDIFFEGGMSEGYIKKILNMKFNDFLSIAVADMYDYYGQKYIPKEKKIKPKINFDNLAELSFDWL